MDILKDCKQFLLDGGLKKMIHDFRNPSWEAYVQHQTVYDYNTDTLREHHYVYFDPPFEYNIEWCRIIYFSKELEIKLNEIKLNLQSSIAALKSSKTSKNTNETLSNIQNEIQNVWSKVKDQDYTSKYQTQFEPFFKELLSFLLKEKSNQESLEEAVYFEFREKIFSVNILEDIYNLEFLGRRFINQDFTEYKTFESILLSEDATKVEGKIYFGCKTIEAAYIIGKMSRYFYNFTPSEVEKSAKFFTKSKKDTVFKFGNFRKAKSEGIDKTTQDAINVCFTTIETKK